MRNYTLTSALVILLVLPTAATAVTLDSLSGQADCDSWSADLTVAFRDGARMARVEYAVALLDADGFEVERFDYADFIEIPETATATTNYTGAWSNALDGLYTVKADFTVYDIFGDGYNTSTGSFIVDLACGSAGGDGDDLVGDACLYRSDHWADNPDLWPVTSLNIGNRTMEQSEMMQILERRRNSFLMFSLLREVITAKLNMANGGSEKIVPIVAEADHYLTNYPENVRRNGKALKVLRKLRITLAKYNRSGCPDGQISGVSINMGDDFDLTGEKAAIEVMSLGTLKATFR